jgi:hypothetical protein
MESTLTAAADDPGFLSGRPLDEWNAAYGKVESYFKSLRVRNKLLRGQLVSKVLDRAMQRARAEPSKTTMALAVEEMDSVITEWYAAVLDERVEKPKPVLSTRGRLALMLADMPGRWQDQFLKAGPWPEEFVSAMRAGYLRAGPDFQFSEMTPRPLELGAITTLTKLGNLPYFRMVLIWICFALLLVILFQITH